MVDVPKGGDPRTGHLTQGTTRTPGWQPKEDRGPTATRFQKVLSYQRGYCTKGRGPKDPSVRRRRDPRTPASRRHSLLQVVAATATTKRVDGRTRQPVRDLRLTPRQAVRGVDRLSCVFSSGMQVEVYLLPKALDENVTKFHIPHSVQNSPSATTFSRDEKFKTSTLVSAHPS